MSQISFSASLRPSVRLKCIAVRARAGNYRVLCFAAEFTTAYGTELRVFYHALTKKIADSLQGDGDQLNARMFRVTSRHSLTDCHWMTTMTVALQVAVTRRSSWPSRSTARQT